jgi:FkbM family methyltransferase
MNGTQLYVTPWGQFNLWPQDHVCKAISEGKFWDEHLKPILDSIPAGMNTIDIGANIGFISIYLANKSKCVYAFEANEETYNVLVSNIEINNYLNKIIPYNVALCDIEKPMRFYKEHFDHNEWWAAKFLENGKLDYSQWEHIGGFTLIDGEGSNKESTYYTKTLDSFSIENVSLIKIDAQGCDLKILKGARNTIEKYHPKLIFEFEPPLAKIHHESLEDYLSFVKSLNYSVVCLTPQNDFYDYVATYNENNI